MQLILLIVTTITALFKVHLYHIKLQVVINNYDGWYNIVRLC